MSLVRRLILNVGIAGCTLFGLAFAASIANPGFVEQIARDVIRYQVEKKTREKVEAIDSHFLAKHAGTLSRGYAEESAQAKRLLAEALPARLAEVIGEMQDLSCECRRKIETSIRDGFEWRIASAEAAQARLTTLIRAQYMDTAGQLTREFRIFTGSNAVVFLLLLVAVLVKPKAGLHLLPSALVLLAAASITAYLYLFNQNWLHTLVFSDFTGLAYVAYLGGAFALLSDIIFNRARVTAEILNFILQALGSAVQVAPC